MRLTAKQQDSGSLEFIKLVLQLAQLEAKVKPMLPAASQKLVTDLLASGVSAQSIGRVIGRKPSYVATIKAGKASLPPISFYNLVRHAMTSGHQNAPKDA